MNNLLTSSRMSALLSCPRKHFWRYETCLCSDAETHALRFGSAWHKAGEIRWNGGDYEQALAVLQDSQFDEYQIATFAGLLAGYFAHYANETFIRRVHPEVEFSQPMSGSRTFTLAGKIDGLVELHDGRLALKEDKTTGDDLSPDSDYWLRLRFNSQLYQYVLAARQLGWDVATIIYDVVRKPSIQPRQIPLTDDQGRKIVNDANGQRVMKKDGSPRESGDKEKGYELQTRIETPDEFNQRLYEDTQTRPDFYFARREVPIIEQDLDEFQAQRLTLSRMILHCRQAEKRLPKPEQAWPRNVGEFSCRNCDFQSFCLQNISVDLAHPPAGFRVGEANPELTKAA